jgi:hypothetical protein
MEEEAEATGCLSGEPLLFFLFSLCPILCSIPGSTQILEKPPLFFL